MSYIIACCDSEWGIGKNNDLPWKHTEDGKNDMKMFKDTTIDSAVIMGYTTFKSIGKPLPKRVNIIVTNSHYDEVDKSYKGVHVFKTLEEAIVFGKKYEETTKKKCFVCGGGKIYKYYLEHFKPNAAYITTLNKKYDCDTFFPHYEFTKYKPKNVENLMYKMYLYTF